MEKENEKKTGGQTSHKVFTVIGIILCVILLPILAVNITLIVKGTLNDTMPPNIFGTTPLVVLSGSMDDGSKTAIEVGDLILVKNVDKNNLKVNDVVAFMEGKYAVTHRIVKVNKAADGTVTYTTRGDANNTEDADQLKPENVIGQYYYKVSGAGNFVLFLQTTTGMLVFVGIPLLIFIAYDIIRRRSLLKTEKLKQEHLKEELERLKNDPASATNPKDVLKEPQEEHSPWEYPKDALKPEPLDHEIRIPAPMPEDYDTPKQAPQIQVEQPKPASQPRPAEQPKPAPQSRHVPQTPKTPSKQPIVVKATKKKVAVIKVKTAKK